MTAQKMMTDRPQPIDGIVSGVTRNVDGTATLHLVPRIRKDGKPSQNGHDYLLVLNPPPFFESIIGTAVWGGRERIMVNTSQIGVRVDYDGVFLTGRKS
jgi:hypothetical protein